MKFGDALLALRQGKRVAREGWNGADQWLILVPGSTITVEADRPLGKAAPELVGQQVRYAPHVDIFATGGRLFPWTPSQSDQLAGDWMVVETEKPTRQGVTDDPSHPLLSHGFDTEPTDQAPVYLVLSEDERAKGFVRPVRREYWHTKCGAVTKMSQSIAETYARNPAFYGSTYCTTCRMHRPVGADGEFHWVDPDNPDRQSPTLDPKVGT